MTIRLNTIELPEFLLTPEFRSGVQASVTRTVGGGIIVQEKSISGIEADLSGDETGPFLTKADLNALKLLSAMPNAVYSLIYISDTYSVRFRNEDQPVIEAVPIFSAPDSYSTDYYHSIRIKLMIL